MANFTRRDFLQLTGSSLFASLSAGLSKNSMAQPSKKVGVALVGLGYYSTSVLAPALELTQHCELKGIVTGSPDKIPQWQTRYGIPDSNVYSYENMHKVANNPDIDVIYVVVPTALHLKYCEVAANAGKHVWCEKPMAMTAAQCQQIINVCNKNKVKLTVGYRMQHEPNTRTFMDYKHTQPYGKIQHIISQAGYAGNGMSADNWRMKKAMGGGAMYDMGVYPLNGARFISGKEPIAITARHDKSHAHIFKNVDETTYFSLEFPEGFTAECATSVVKSFNQLKVTGEKGWYQLSPMQSYSGVTGLTNDGKRFPPIKEMQQAIQMDNDALAISRNGPILVSGEEGMRDIRIVEAAFASAATGKRVRL